MKRALWAVPVLVLMSAWFARGAYTYYYIENGVSPVWSNWIVETTGSASLVSQWYSPGGFGGIVSNSTTDYGRMTYPSTSASPGEISLTYRVGSPAVYGMTTDVFVAASSDFSLLGGWVGSAYQLEMSYTSSGSYYGLYKKSGGSTISLASGGVGIAEHDNMTLRVVRHSNGLILAYLDNVRFLMYSDTSLTGGRMAFNVYNQGDTLADTPLISSVKLGPLDSTAPNAIPSGSIGISPYSNHIDLQWPAATDDTNGSGVYGYEIYRNGGLLATTSGTTFSDTTVVPHTSYTYTLAVRDFHGNYAATNFSLTTPGLTTGPFPSATPEGRRVGVRTTGAYWGATGENIDVMSGNLSYSLPLLSAKARSGWSAGFNLSYNSQNWRHDSGGNWKFGNDVGYGWGWRLMAGSVTPAYSDPYTVSYYLFTDSTGAEYRLDQNSGNVWSSKESIYVYYDANSVRLYFRDGSFWYMGCTSAATESDSGVTYPTLMQDSNGNQVAIGYQTSPGAGWTNSSSRITQINDTRWNGSSSTYAFTYDTSTPPHLTAITNSIGTGENYSFTYLTGQSLSSPFDSTSYGTTATLRDVTVTANSTYQEFTYNGSGELTQILLPYKGYLAYDYTTATYSSGRNYREVLHRNLSKDGIATTQYSFSHEASPGPDVHQFTVLDDPGGVGEKYWTFATSGLAMGLVTQYQGRQLPGPVAKVQNDYTWAQDSIGNSYIASATTTADPGQSYAAAKKTDQTVDTHGNVTQVKTYDYGNLTTPVRTDNYTYLTGYSGLYIFNRITSTPTATIAYDEFSLSTAPGDVLEWVSPGTNSRGNPTTVVSHAGTQTMHYDFGGAVLTTTVNGLSSSITTTSATNYTVPSQVTVGSLSTTMTYNSFLGLTNETDPNSASTTIGYDAMSRPNSKTSPFGATTTNTYHETASPPYAQTTVNGRWTRTTMDGLGRNIKTETGDGSGTLSVAETVYDSCGCSPTGKMKQTALPHAPGATPVWTTYTYDGIGRTLTVSTVGTDTTSTTSYSYQGNAVTVTDAVGNWKKYTTNAMGELIQVNEPNPAGGSDYVTTYAYDTLGHLTSMSMPRPSGTQTRTFNYGNPPGAQLLSTTNPENGTVTYSYNSDKTLAEKIDAKGQHTQYSYDAYKRVSQVRRGTWGSIPSTVTVNARNWGSYWNIGTASNQNMVNNNPSFDSSAQNYTFQISGNLGLANLRVYYVNDSPSTPWMIVNSLTLNGAGYSPSSPVCSSGSLGNCYVEFSTASGWTQPIGLQEDTCHQENYSYDTNPYDGSFSQNTLGRLAAVRYMGGYNASANPTCDTTFTEMYSYSSAGARLKKRLRVSRAGSFDLDSQYTYDNEGRMTAQQYPPSWNGSAWVAGPNLGNTFDSMGRLQKLTDLATTSDIISSTSYGAAGQLLTITGANGAPSETRTYNSIGQMTALQSGSLNIQYVYPATQNNGKIASQKDLPNGEEIDYTYDVLNRLAKAETLTDPNLTQWGQSYTYDGFGNLTTVATTKGSTPTLVTTYDPATNRQTGECSDANGNINSASSCTNGNYFDVENRLVRNGGSSLLWAYSYAPGNKRVWRGVWSGSTQTTDEITYWGAGGQKLVTYQLSVSGSSLVATATGTNEYFGGKVVKNATGYVTPDRAGSIGKYFPYGQERPSATTDGKEKFATYFRDSETGLDYARNRYHQPGMGRFMTPDRMGGHDNDPGTWNKYSYTAGDPVNRVDTSGNDFCAIDSLSENGVPLSDQCNGNTGDCVETSDPSSCLAELIAIDEQNANIASACGGTVDAFGIWDGTGPPPGVSCGGVGEQPPPQKPDCINGFPAYEVGFVVANIGSAITLGSQAGIPQDWVLAWSALESYWGTRGVVTTNGNYIGWTGPGDVICGPGANRHFGCFSGFNASLTTALFSTANRFHYGKQISHVPAASILADQYGQGASVASAFDTLAHAGYTPDPGYGAGVASRDSEVLRIENCLRQDGLLK